MWFATVVAVAVALYGGWLYGRISATKKDQRRFTNLQALNALLRTLTSSPDVTRSLFELASRVRAITACDRVGLALLTDDREGYTTYTARLDAAGPSREPVPDLHFPRTGTLIDEVVRAREPRAIGNLSELAPAYLDANVLTASRYSSLVLLPLVFEGEALGTLNLVARKPGAFSQADLDMLSPVAEALGAAYGTRRLAYALARHQMASELAELIFAFANDMNGAVQALSGGCELMARESRDPALAPQIENLQREARRIREILNRMQRITREHAGGPSRAS